MRNFIYSLPALALALSVVGCQQYDSASDRRVQAEAQKRITETSSEVWDLVKKGDRAELEKRRDALVERSKVVATQGSLASLAFSLESFRAETGNFPDTAAVWASLGQNSKSGQPYFADMDLRMDGWGRPVQYRYPGKYYPDRYDLFSFGPNGVGDGGDIDDVWRTDSRTGASEAPVQYTPGAIASGARLSADVRDSILDKSNALKTKREMALLKLALDAYKDNFGGQYPTSEGGFSEVRKKMPPADRPKNWKGPYVALHDGNVKDAWGTPFQYVGPRNTGEGSFRLYSFGPNRTDDGAVGDDIVYDGGAEFQSAETLYRNLFAQQEGRSASQ